jgi:hypothetical protein
MAEQLLLLQESGCVSGRPAELAASRESAITEFIGEDGAEFLARHAGELDVDGPGPGPGDPVAGGTPE